MNTYYSSLIKDYRNAEKRALIYDSVIKEHKSEMKKLNHNTKEYKEIKDMIKFVKNLEDYKRVSKTMILSLFAMSRA